MERVGNDMRKLFYVLKRGKEYYVERHYNSAYYWVTGIERATYFSLEVARERCSRLSMESKYNNLKVVQIAIGETAE